MQIGPHVTTSAEFAMSKSTQEICNPNIEKQIINLIDHDYLILKNEIKVCKKSGTNDVEVFVSRRALTF